MLDNIFYNTYKGKLLEPLLNAAPASFLIINNDSQILISSKESAKMLVLSEDITILNNKRLSDFVVFDQRLKFKDAVSEVFKGKKIENAQFNIDGIKENDFFAEISMSPILVGGKVKNAICLIRDVTAKRKSDSIAQRLYSELKEKISKIEEQNKALEDTKAAVLNILDDETELRKDLEMQEKVVEQKVVQRTKELQSEKSKLSASIDALLKAFIMIDLKKNIIQTNKNIENVLGTFKEGITFESLSEKLKNSFDFVTSFDECQKTKNRATYDNINFGSKILEIRVSPVFSGESEEDEKSIIGVLYIIGDVTDEKVLERSKDEFFSIASHELRTPLTAIRGNASLIKQYYFDEIKNQDMKDMINDIEESSVRLISIVNDFLNLSRLEQNRLEFKYSNFDLYELCKKGLEEVGSTKGNKDIKISIKKPSQKTVCYADNERVMQIIVNLIGNSFKFTEKGFVKIYFDVSNDSITVYVADSGRGIALENQKLLFRKFQQASDSLFTRDTTKGTGLGLYISKLMIEGMKGKIWLEKSEIGKGSVFAFSLPTSF